LQIFSPSLILLIETRTPTRAPHGSDEAE